MRGETAGGGVGESYELSPRARGLLVTDGLCNILALILGGNKRKIEPVNGKYSYRYVCFLIRYFKFYHIKNIFSLIIYVRHFT